MTPKHTSHRHTSLRARVAALATACVVTAIALPAGAQAPMQPDFKDYQKAEIKLPPSRPVDPVPAERSEPRDEALREAARQEIEEAARSKSAIVRGHAVEAVQDVFKTFSPEKARSIILTALSDPSPFVRFSAAAAAGQLRMREAYEPLCAMTTDPDPNVHTAVLYALHRLGDTRFSQDLLIPLRDPRDGVRGNAVTLLGRLGEKSAIPALRRLRSDSQPAVRLQVAEALYRLGDQTALQDLIAVSVSKFPDEQVVAILALPGGQDPRVLSHIQGRMADDFVEVSLAAARSAGKFGSDAGMGVALRCTKDPDARRRYMSALALGAIGRRDAQTALAPLLKDDEPDVRLAAATAILMLR